MTLGPGIWNLESGTRDPGPKIYTLAIHANLRYPIGPMSQETTLVLFKPDAITKSLVGSVLSRFEASGLRIRGIRMLRFSDDLLREHYAHIASKPFFPEVQEFMQRTPVIALALSGPNAVARVRDLLGPTDSRKAAKGTIRGDLGVDVMVNVCHASDSPETATAELTRFFPEGELFDA